MDYLSHFGLKHLPFTTDAYLPDYYQAGEQGKILLQIQTRIVNSEAITSIGGQSGLGKSILATQLAQNLSPDLYIPVLIRQKVSSSLSHVRVLLAIAAQTLASSQESQRGVVILDGAGSVSDEIIDFVTDWASEKGAPLILFGTSQQSDIELSAWSDSAIARMIVHRLRGAGADRSLIDKDALLSLVQRAAGNPGDAVLLCAEALLCAWQGGAESVTNSVAAMLVESDLDFDAVGQKSEAVAVPDQISVDTDSGEVPAETELQLDDLEQEALGELDSLVELDADDSDLDDELAMLDSGLAEFEQEIESEESVDLDAELDVEVESDDDLGFMLDDLVAEEEQEAATDQLAAEDTETDLDEEFDGLLLSEDSDLQEEDSSVTGSSELVADNDADDLSANLDADLDQLLSDASNDLALTDDSQDVTEDDSDDVVDDLDDLDDLDSMLGEWEAETGDDSSDEGLDEQDLGIDDLELELSSEAENIEEEDENFDLDLLLEDEELGSDDGENIEDTGLNELDAMLEEENVEESELDDLDSMLDGWDSGVSASASDTASETVAEPESSQEESLEDELDDLLKEFGEG